jgi:hypothetical protein
MNELKAIETENSVLRAQIDRMYKELEKKDEEICKLEMQLDERKIVMDNILSKITLKE